MDLPPTSEPEPSAPFRAPHPNHVRRVLESHPTAFWGGQELNPHKEPGRALMSWCGRPERCLEPVEGGLQSGSRSLAWIVAVAPISSMKPATRVSTVQP